MSFDFADLSKKRSGGKMDSADWKLVILGQLRIRNQRENGGFSELITSRKTRLDLGGVS